MNTAKKIKILHLIESLVIGGAQKRLINDLKYLGDERFEHFLCYLYPINQLDTEIPSYARKQCLNMKSIYDIKKTFRGMKVILKGFKPDIIHTHLFGANLYGRVFGTLFSDAKIVTTLHSIDYRKFIKGDATKYKYSFKRIFIDFITNFFVDRFIAVSEYLKNLALIKFGLKNVNVIYNYLEFKNYKNTDNAFLSDFKKKLNIEKSFVIFNSSNLRPQKGQKYLILAMKELTDVIHSIKLLIAGNGPLWNDFKSLIEKSGLEKNVFLLGQRDDIVDLLSISDVFVFPSLCEGQGIALLEAMAAGIPCVATNIGPIPEIIQNGKTGILVEPQNPNQIAEAILELRRDPEEASRIALEGKKYALEKFNVKNSIEKLSKLYEELFYQRFSKPAGVPRL